MDTKNILAVDYGASNGRGIIGKFDGERLALDEAYRFNNNPVRVLSHFYWDILSLFSELKSTIRAVYTKYGHIDSLGIDAWGVDYGLIDKNGNLLGNPHHYRDNRTAGIEELIADNLSKYDLFLRTGMYPSQICTLFQLIAARATESAILNISQKLLFIPGLIDYFLTGIMACDSTSAATSLLYNSINSRWADELLDIFNIPHILPEIVKPGTVLSNMPAFVSDELGINRVPVISVAQHDTASAISAVPANDKRDVLYISCGTWSVVGTSIDRSIVDEQAFRNGFNNEIGYGNEIMFVQNLTGLWVLQECIREWAYNGYKMDYDVMNDYALNSLFDSIIDLDCESFVQPGNMCDKIIRYCKDSGQKIPRNKGDIYKCIVLSLSAKYRDCICNIQKLTGRQYAKIHIVGGGARNKLLCQLTANMTGKNVLAGPYEATAIGNIMIQLMAIGEIKDMHDGRQIISNSFNIIEYKPGTGRE